MNPTANPSLAKLHDYYQPVQPSWIPQTIGWYVLFAICALLFFWFSIHAIRRWLTNRYRREALRELATTTPAQFSALLKRTALAAWPREKVASLSGDAWLQFLGDVAATESFRSPPGNRIEELAFSGGTTSREDEQALRTIATEWIRRHRVQA
ncbi:MAG TPA: DUF4381 domain-containing protein [Edaphobacter sp.]|jgi:hypothetical protein|nr:DUF4381 domain-containing protein [Edaphobacter sp.]